VLIGKVIDLKVIGAATFADALDGLSAGMFEIDQAFRDVLIAAGTGDAAVGIKGIALPLTARDGERHVAHVPPLTSGARRHAGIATSAAAALFVHKAALDIPSPPEAIAGAYKLTPTELRVLLAIVEIGGVPEVAVALGIGDATVRTFRALHSAFKKLIKSLFCWLVKPIPNRRS
jgi:hypothetical protein